MQAIIGNDTITMLFGRNRIVVDVKEDKLYVNGSHLRTTDVSKEYDEELVKEKNVKFPKKELLKIGGTESTLKITIGYDGRIFFNIYENRTINEWRTPPVESFSYWHDRKTHRKAWYDNDLRKPERVWMTKYKTDIKTPNLQTFAR